MPKINGQDIKEKILLSIFEKESEKMRIKLNYNYFKLLESIYKGRKDFNIENILKKTDSEILEEMGKLELPSLDRANKNNLKFTDRKKEIPKDFKNKIEIEI
jgi:hypothetical protein